MNETRKSLIAELSTGADSAWRELDRVYRPLIHNWLSKYDLQRADVDDLTQEVMSMLTREITTFAHNGRVGAFRRWLRTITAHRARTMIRSKRLRPASPGTESFQDAINQLEDDTSRVSIAFDEEHDQHVIRRLLESIALDFTESTMRAFERSVLHGEPPQQVAESLGITAGAVYIARSRVMKELRQRAQGLLE